MDICRPSFCRKFYECARADPEFKTEIRFSLLAFLCCFILGVVLCLVVVFEHIVEEKYEFLIGAGIFFVISLYFLYISCSTLIPAWKKVKQEMKYSYSRIRAHRGSPIPSRRVRSQRMGTGYVVQYVPGLETDDTASGLLGVPSVNIPITFEESDDYLPGYEPPLEGAVGGAIGGATGGELTSVLVHREHERERY